MHACAPPTRLRAACTCCLSQSPPRPPCAALQANPEKVRQPLLHQLSRLGLTPEGGLDLEGPGVQPHAEAALRAAAPIAAQFMEAS